MSTIKENLFLPGMLFGFISPLFAIIASLFFYIRHRKLIEPERRVPVVAYVLASIICGGGVGYAGIFLGIALACPRAGNLCGLFGFFVTGPILFSLAILVVGLALFLVRPTAKS